MKTVIKVSLVLMLLVFMIGCAQQTWQAKGTAIYVGAGKTLKAADTTFQELKSNGLVSPEQVAKYDPLYKQAYNSYWTAGDGWKLALRAGTDVEQKKYMEAFSKNFADFQKFVADIVSLVNGIAVKEGGVK